MTLYRNSCFALSSWTNLKMMYSMSLKGSQRRVDNLSILRPVYSWQEMIRNILSAQELTTYGRLWFLPLNSRGILILTEHKVSTLLNTNLSTNYLPYDLDYSIIRKQGNSRKKSTSASVTTLKPLTVWITTNWKILKEMGIQDYLTCLLRNL